MGKKGGTSQTSSVPEWMSKAGEQLYGNAYDYVFGKPTGTQSGANNTSTSNMQNGGGTSNVYGQTATGAGAPQKTGSYYQNFFSPQGAQANIFQPNTASGQSGGGGGELSGGILGQNFQPTRTRSVSDDHDILRSMGYTGEFGAGGAQNWLNADPTRQQQFKDRQSQMDFQLSQSVSPLTGNQQAAANLANTLGTTPFFGTNYFAPARGYANQAANMMFNERYDPNAVSARDVGTGQWNSRAAQQYMNPFVQQALDPSLQRMQENAARQVYNNNMMAAKTGSFGGSRGAVQNALTQSENQRNQQEALYKGLADAYQSALGGYQTDAARKLQAGLANQAKDVNLGQFNETQRMNAIRTNADVNNQNRQALLAAGQLLGALGSEHNAVQNSNVDRLLKTGAVQQATNQQALQNEYDRFYANQQRPLNYMSQLSGIMAQNPERITTTQQPSGMGQFLGGLLSIAGAPLSGGTSLLGSGLSALGAGSMAANSLGGAAMLSGAGGSPWSIGGW